MAIEAIHYVTYPEAVTLHVLLMRRLGETRSVRLIARWLNQLSPDLSKRQRMNQPI